jgi:hypothetical protein
MRIDKEFCMSSYLAFRFVAEEEVGFSKDYIPAYPHKDPQLTKGVSTAEEIDRTIKEFINKHYNERTGILLSGGMDSAIVASYLPAGTKAYSIRFIAPNAIDETIMARKYAEKYNLDLTIVEVYWEDYLRYSEELMENRKSPLHQIECAVYKAALTAKKDGIEALLMGNGADYLFGGLDKLLSRDWSFDGLVERYTIVKPEQVLVNPVSIVPVYERFRTGPDSINFFGFLEDVHGLASIPSFENPLSLAGIKALEPYESMKLSVPLDIARIRAGESKYLIRELFSLRYPDIPQPDKIPFKRPMDQWLEHWEGPTRAEFLPGCVKGLSGDQRWLVYCLEWFLNYAGL